MQLGGNRILSIIDFRSSSLTSPFSVLETPNDECANTGGKSFLAIEDTNSFSTETMNPTAQPSADVPASAQHPASMKLSDSERREIRQARKERMDARWREEAKPLSYSPSHW